MYLTDKITKGFLTGNGQWNPRRTTGDDASLSRWADYEDPTYMGFYFAINPDGYYDPTNLDMDVLPMGLFMDYDEGGPSGQTPEAGGIAGYKNVADGAESFLRRRGEYYRAGMIREFREGFLKVVAKEPWIFEKVTGLEALWKVDPANPYRAKDKKIIFECHETISMKMTYLIDCYRKASYDFANMRHMLPDTQRYFSMDLWVTEIRYIKRPLIANPTVPGVPSVGSPSTPDENGNPLGLFFNTGSFIRYRLDYCEFDFLTEESIGYLGDLARYAGDKPAHVKIPIKVGAIREVNNYGMMGGLIADTFYNYQRGKAAMYSSFTKATSIQGEAGDGVTRGENVGKFAGDIRDISYNNADGFKDERARNSSAASKTEGVIGAYSMPSPSQNLPGRAQRADLSGEAQPAPSSLTNIDLKESQPSPVNLADANALGGNSVLQASNTLVEGNLGSVDVGSRARSLAGNLLRAAFLGNVYGLSLTTLAGELQGILNNPVAAIQGLLSKFAKSPEEASTMADNVNLSGADIDIIKGFIGDIKEIQSVTAGTSLANATLGELTRLEPPKATSPNPPNQTLQSASNKPLLQSELGKILFGASPVAAQAVAKQALEGPASTIDANLDTSTVPLEGDKAESTDLGSTSLENNGTKLEGPGLGNIGFPGLKGNRGSSRVSN
jgi:hypothetical protein